MESLLNSFEKENNLLLLKKKEFDVYYSCTHRFPLCVVEKITKNTGKTIGEPIRRKEIKDPFKADMKLPKEYRLKIKDFNNYMEYGGSLGHNAPAGNHKTNIGVYSETFLLSNNCPQEIVFNSGIWVLLEGWCRDLAKDNDLTDITVYTGSIPDNKTQNFNDSVLNVPTHMFKVVTCRHIKEPNVLYIACFLMPNLRPVERIYKLYKYMVRLKDISIKSGINFFQMFNKYSNFNQTKDRIHSIKHKVRVDVHLKDNRMLIKQMKSSFWYGEVIYSKTLSDLEDNWSNCKKHGFDDEFHETYYKYAKKRILKEDKIKGKKTYIKTRPKSITILKRKSKIKRK
jgi:DNA/RNA endonuclease G (NUC1)